MELCIKVGLRARNAWRQGAAVAAWILVSMLVLLPASAGAQNVGQGRADKSQITSCTAQASQAYSVPVPAINAVLSNGLAPGEIKDDRVGPMGLPLAWIPVFEYMGIQGQSLISDVCQNVYAGVWLMAMQRADRKSVV